MRAIALDPSIIRLADLAKGGSYVVASGLAAGLAVSALGSSSRGQLVASLLVKPLTRALLIVIALGLTLHAISKVARAVWDRDDDPEGVMRRGLLAAEGAVHLLAAIVTFAGSYGAGREHFVAWSARLISPAAGAWAVMGLGGALMLAGAFQIYRATGGIETEAFEPSIRSWPHVRRFLRLGQAGVIARGLALPMIGAFLIITAAQSTPYEAPSLAASLDALLARVEGPYLLLFVAATCALYGGAVIALAGYKRD